MSSLANAALGDVLVEARPGFACGDDAADGVFQFRMNNITTEGQLDLSKKRRVPRDSRNIDRYLVEPGDVLFNATNSPDLVGKTAYLPGLEEPAVFSNHFLRLRPDPDRLDGRFLSHWLNVQFQRGRFKGMCRQWVNQATVNRDALLAMQIPLPPLPEQRRIAEILDKADALRAKRRAAFAQLDNLTQSIFLDMFRDPVTNPMGWEERHLPDLVSKRKHALKRGPFGGALKKEIFVPEGFKVYEQRNVIYDDFDIGSYFIKTSDYERLAPFKVSSNNLLISCSGTIGRIAAVPLHAAPGVMNQALLKIDLDESIMLNSFFLFLWRSQSFEQQVLGMTHGTGMKNMKSMAELKGINFLVPPLNLQHRFAAIVESIEQQRARQRAHLAELDALFASLQQRAFRADLVCDEIGAPIA